MKDILIGLLVVAVVLLVLGAVNSGVHVDLDYLFGDWRGVSLLWLAVIAVGVVVVAALVTASLVRMRVIGDCRKLEAELQRTYTRLREAEASLAEAGDETAAGRSDPPDRAAR